MICVVLCIAVQCSAKLSSVCPYIESLFRVLVSASRTAVEKEETLYSAIPCHINTMHYKKSKPKFSWANNHRRETRSNVAHHQGSLVAMSV